MEEWKEIIGFPDYLVSNLGKIKKKNKDKEIGSFNKSTGYMTCVLIKDKIYYPKYIHRLVAENFIDNTNNLPTVDHINRDRTDNTVTNLRWASWETQSYNKEERIGITGCKYITKTPNNTFRFSITRKNLTYKSPTFKTLQEAIDFRNAFLESL